MTPADTTTREPSELAKELATSAIEAAYDDPDEVRLPDYDVLAEIISTAGLADLEAKLAAAEAELKEHDGWAKAMHRKLEHYIGPQIYRVRKDLCSSCTGKGTGLICSDCDGDSAQEALDFKLQRDAAEAERDEAQGRLRKIADHIDFMHGADLEVIMRLATADTEESDADNS